MKFAIQTDKKNRHKIIVRVLFVISVVAVCVGCVDLIRERNMRIAEEERIRQEEERIRQEEERIRQEEERIRQEEEQYIKLERFFGEKKDNLQKFIELSTESILGEEEYIILFDKSWYYSSSRSAYKQSGWMPVLYDNGTFVLEEDNAEIEKTLNENTDLAETLNAIRENEVIISIHQINLDEDMWTVSFGISTEFTPFIVTNDINKRFIYCENVDDERYEYEKIEDNWYTYIGLNEKGRDIQEGKQYIELEKLFLENGADMQRFIDAFDESAMGKKEYFIFFDSEDYREVSRHKKEDYLSVLYIGAFVIDEDEEMEEVFNKNTELKEAVKTIKENEVITDIGIFYIEESMRKVEFMVDTKFTPFISTNQKNSFVWCDNEDCIRYGYKNVEGNWYVKIGDEPDG